MIRTFEYDLFNYLDSLRKKRKISQEELTFGITDTRLYRRYLSGETKPSIEILSLLVDKLGLRFEFFIRDFVNQKNDNKVVFELISSVVNHDIKTAEILLKTINRDSLIHRESILTYDISLLMKSLIENYISDDDFTYKAKKLINYPKILSLEVFSLMESYVLCLLLVGVSADEKDEISAKLESFMLEQSHVIYSENYYIANMILHALAKHYQSTGQHAKAIFLCEVGIKTCKSKYSMYLLDRFYYITALCEKSLGNHSSFEENLFKCFCTIIADGDSENKKRFDVLFAKNINVSIEEFAANYFKNKYKL